MGLVGGAFLIGGIGLCLAGLITVGVGLWEWQWGAVLEGLVLLVSGLVSGAVGTAILE